MKVWNTPIVSKEEKTTCSTRFNRRGTTYSKQRKYVQPGGAGGVGLLPERAVEARAYKPSSFRRRFELSHDGPEGLTLHTFCRKMSEDMIDKERIIVGISWVLGTAGRVSLKTLKLLLSFPYKHVGPIVTAAPI